MFMNIIHYELYLKPGVLSLNNESAIASTETAQIDTLLRGAQPVIPPNLYSVEFYWAALSLSFRRISIRLFINIIAWGPQVSGVVCL